MTELETVPEAAPRHRVRRTFTWILVVLTALLVGIASVSVWATRTVFNDDRFSATVTDVVSDPAVISAASVFITDQVESAVVASGVLDDVPPALRPVIAVLQGAVRGRVEEGVSAVLSSDAGQALLGELLAEWATAAATADTPEFRARLLANLETGTDRRAERYWQLLGIINGWPPIPSMVRAFEWVIAALRASGETPGAA